MRGKSLLLVSIILLGVLSQALPPPQVYATEPDPIGYSIEGDVVTIWNPDTAYYFNKSSGIQWTEDPDAYWTRNIFAIGYFDGDEWNKIYSADELGNFNREIESDYLTYVNATLWRDFNYGGYDLRLGIRYHLKLEDTDLSVIIYAKNLDTEAYPYPLGISWTVTNIDIPNPNGKDTIFINGTDYRLDGFYDLPFTNMSHTYFDHDLNETVTEYDSHYRMFDWTEFITLEWDAGIPYTVRLQCNGVQSEAWVTWMVNAGIFQAGQEKSTTLYWADAEGDYTGIHWDTAGDGAASIYGLATNGTNMWAVDYDDDDVYKWDMVGGYVTKWDVSGDGVDQPGGITTDGSNIWVVDREDDEVYKYQMDGTYVGSWDTSGEMDDSSGITTDGSNIWIVDFTNTQVYKYNMAGTYQASSFDTAASGNAAPNSIATDGNYIWITDTTDELVYKYSMTGTASGSWDISNEALDGRAMTNDGNYIWVCDRTTDEIHKYEYILPNADPTTTSASISNMDDGDNLLAMRTWYDVVGVGTDTDGATDIDKIYVQAKNNGALLWEVRATDLTSTPAWTIESGDTIIDLDSGSCTWGEAGDVGTATFKVMIEGDHPQFYDLELFVYVEDSAAASAGFTEMQSDYFDVINRLVTINLVTSDGRMNIGGSPTISADVRYSLTTSGDDPSSLYPPDAQFTGGVIHDSAHGVLATDASVVNGAISASGAIPSSAQTNTYHIYLDMAGDWPDADAPDGDTVNVIGDRYNVTDFWSSDNTPEWNQTFTLYAFIASEYDSHAGASGDTLNISGYSFDYDDGNSRFYTSMNKSVLNDYVFDSLDDFSAETYGITAVHFLHNLTATVENTAPTSPTINNLENNTQFEPSTTLEVGWTFNDIYETDSQSAYQIQYSASDNFTEPLYDSAKTTSSNEYQEVTFSQELGEYYIRFKTWDILDSESPWTDLIALEVAHPTTEGGWTPGGTTTGSIPTETLDTTEVYTPNNLANTGIIVIVGVVVSALLFNQVGNKKKGVDGFSDKSKAGTKRKPSKKKKEGPKDFKRKRR